MNSKLSRFIRQVADRTSVIRAIRVALVVGVILNIINNPHLFSVTSSSSVHPVRVVLTFIVPFCVSLYSSFLANSKSNS